MLVPLRAGTAPRRVLRRPGARRGIVERAGRSRASATSSLRDFAESDAGTTRILVLSEKTDMPAKSRSAS